jgi:hypothetical protein
VPFEQSGQTGAAPFASAQTQQTYRLVVDAGQTVTTDAFLLRGMSRLTLLALQTAGAVGAVVQPQVATSDQVTPVPNQRPVFRALGGPAVMALGIAQNLPFVIPARQVRVAVTAPVGNAVTLDITFFCSQ